MEWLRKHGLLGVPEAGAAHSTGLLLSPECCNNQKLLLEYEKYQELQLKSQRMQEEYEKQLRDNDETKSQALEELTEFYEAKLQEKTNLLEEVF